MNNRVRNLTSTLLSDDWYTLKRWTFEYRDRRGQWGRQEREAYDRGNGATIILYNRPRRTILLTRQFRLPTLLNGNPDGMLIEACAGLLDNDDPETCIKKEIREETGYCIENVTRIFEQYTSPGSVTEVLHFFIGTYELRDKTGSGGGLPEEQEDIEIIEVNIERAYAMIQGGEIRDAKTTLLIYHLLLHQLR